MSQWRVDNLWDTVCFVGCSGEPFRPSAVIHSLIQDGWKRKTAELSWQKFKTWALRNPTEFSGPASRLTKIDDKFRLLDNPEL